MRHDALCELNAPRYMYVGPSCQCGSRAHPLCMGCRDGRHQQHQTPSLDNDGATIRCACDLCSEGEVA